MLFSTSFLGKRGMRRTLGGVLSAAMRETAAQQQACLATRKRTLTISGFINSHLRGGLVRSCAIDHRARPRLVEQPNGRTVELRGGTVHRATMKRDQPAGHIVLIGSVSASAVVVTCTRLQGETWEVLQAIRRVIDRAVEVSQLGRCLLRRRPNVLKHLRRHFGLSYAFIGMDLEGAAILRGNGPWINRAAVVEPCAHTVAHFEV